MLTILQCKRIQSTFEELSHARVKKERQEHMWNAFLIVRRLMEGRQFNVRNVALVQTASTTVLYHVRQYLLKNVPDLNIIIA